MANTHSHQRKLGCYRKQHRLADARSLAEALTTRRGIHFVDFLKRVSGTYGHASLYLGQIPHKLTRCRKVPVATRVVDETSDKKIYFSYPSGKYLECFILGTAPSPQHTQNGSRVKNISTKEGKAVQEWTLPLTSGLDDFPPVAENFLDETGRGS